MKATNMVKVGGTLRAFAHSFMLGWQNAWAQKSALISFFIGYGVLTGLWMSIWLLVPLDKMAAIGLSYGEIIWYFVTTELVLFSLGQMYKDVEGDIRSGQVEIFFLRPVNYISLKSAEWLGYSCLRMVVFFPGIALFAFCVTQHFPFNFYHVVVLPVALVLGFIILLLLQIIIGLSAAWFRSARPMWMIVQKGVFVLGGLIVPVTFYPEALQAILWFTPFPAILYAPASLVLESSPQHIVAILGLQVFWLAMCLLLVAMVQKRFERHLLSGEAL